MRSSFRIATLGDIEVGIHYSWILVFLLVAWTLAVGFFPDQLPRQSAGTYWAMGFIASFLLFVSVLIHELAHSFVAEYRGLRVRSITLFVFGGISNISGEPANAPDELLIAGVGPLSSLVLAAIFWGIWIGLGPTRTPVESVLFYLAFVNALLAAFNLIPGFPLDGGRVLRAVLWWITNSLDTATRIAVGAGHVVAFLFIFFGILLAFSGAFISGLWLILIGWFLNNAAGASGRQTEALERFRGVKVSQVMDPHPVTVKPTLSLTDLVNDHILLQGVRALPVVEDDTLLGMVTLNEIRAVPRDQWDATQVSSVMTRVEDLQMVRPEDDLSLVVKIMGEQDINQLPVVENGRLVGLVSRSNLINYLQVMEELGAPTPGGERRPAA